MIQDGTIGSTVACRCGATLKVGADGLTRLAGGGSRPASAGGTPVSSTTQPTAPAGSGLSGNTGKAFYYLEWVGWGIGFFYVPGLFFTLMFLLLPQMDEAGVNRMRLSYQEDNAPYRKKEIDYKQKLFDKQKDFRKRQRDMQYHKDDLAERLRKLDKREASFTAETSKTDRDDLAKDREALRKEGDTLEKDSRVLNAEADSNAYLAAKEMRGDKDAIDKDHDDWVFKKQYLMVDQTQAETSAAGRRVWYLWGLLFATIMLMLGAIGYLSPKQGMWRRVIGVVTVAAIVLLIAAKMNGGRSVIIGAATSRAAPALTLATAAQAHTLPLRQSRPHPTPWHQATAI
jgi:hypothetical protein